MGTQQCRGKGRNSGYRGTELGAEEQWVQRIRRYAGTEDQRVHRNTGTVDTQEQRITRYGGTVGKQERRNTRTEEKWV